jgi:membrane fusion protein, multidrug efflux system
MLKKFLIGFLMLGAVIGGIVFIKAKQFAGGPPPQMPASVVTSALAREDVWEVSRPSVGTLRADHGVQVAGEAGGVVERIAFESGARVKAGDILVELNTEIERAQLQAAEARVGLAELDAKRARDLVAQNASAQSGLDAAEAQLKQALAERAQIEAALRLKVVRAPFAGRLGIRLISLGQFVERGTPLVSLQALDPMHADFTLPQQDLFGIAPGNEVRLVIDALPGRVFSGRITAINPQVDTQTRSVGVQATFANAEDLLRPGMFARVSVVAPEKKSVVIVPTTAVYFQPYGDTLFVIKGEKAADGSRTVEQRFIRRGEARGDYIVIESGIAAGEEVVTTGVFKLSNGAKVMVDNTQALTTSLTPKPENT